nr:hypothetical protein [Propionicimonas sp.]
MTHSAHLYGLSVRSDVPLHQDRPAPTTMDADVVIRRGAPVADLSERPEGRILLDLNMDRQYFTAVAVEDGYRLRFYGTCDVLIDTGLRAAVIHPVPEADPDLLPVLAGGTLLAFILSMRGEAVLHASAVQVGDSALAFVGYSGMGKSTMATLLCADGATLITDDLLRLDLRHRPPTCALGATELRLRKAAGDLAARFPVTPGHRVTADARDALSIPISTTPDLPLAAIVVPQPDRELDPAQARVERMDPMAAFLLLTRFPRLLGWQDEEVLRRQFQQLGDIVESVPVYTAHLPWGPPFPDEIPGIVLHAVGLA